MIIQKGSEQIATLQSKERELQEKVETLKILLEQNNIETKSQKSMEVRSTYSENISSKEELWIKLCEDLNSKLSSRIKNLKIKLSPKIKDNNLWKDWKDSNKIYQALDYLQNAKGNPGLKFFRDVLVDLGEDVSVSIIDSSSFKARFA